MKIFIVNVNNCLNLAQYEPFFYEHIYKKQLTMLDEIKDTCDLNIAYEQILSQYNQHPFTIDEGVVFVFIPRVFSKPLKAQDYELFNDINAYMCLAQKLSDKFKVVTFYVDKTGALEASDAVYNQLRRVNDNISLIDKKLEQYFPLLDPENTSYVDYREYISEKIKDLAGCTKSFFSDVLQEMPEMSESAVDFKNGINYYVSVCKKRLSKVEHMYAHIVRDDVSEEIETKLKVVYYIKSLTEEAVSLKTMSEYKNFDTPDYEHIKSLLSTYRTRLSLWYNSPCPISQTGKYTEWTFDQKTKANAEYNREVDAIINEQLKDLKTENVGEKSVVDAVFEKLNTIISAAQGKLEAFGIQQANEIHDPSNYRAGVEQEFDLSEPTIEDDFEEKQQLERLNKHAIHNLPMFADENRLIQDLEIINNQITQIFSRLKACKIKSFIVTLVVGIFVVGGFYLWTQKSVFAKEHTWHIFLGYLAVTLVGFALSYFIVKKKYLKQISELLLESKKLVEKYICAYKEIAKEFEENLEESRKYYCLKKKLMQKEKARNDYNNEMDRYLWHMKKVDEILTNFGFFEHFIEGVLPQKEDIVFESFEHDAEHTEFYQIKFF